MKLTEIFPEESFRAKFDADVRIETRDKSKLKEISLLKSSCMAEIGGEAWDRYIQLNPEADSQALAEFFQRNDAKIYLAMERHTGIDVLRDLSYTIARVADDKLPEESKSELLLAVTYPNVLRISDVTFANPYNPIAPSERKYRFQHYEGLGFFQELIHRCEEYCRQYGINEITLAAAYIDLVPFFESYGFQIEDTPAGRAYLKMREGIPMVKIVGERT